MRANLHDIVNQQITGLLTKAAERPTKDDPMGIIGLGSTLLAAQMWAKQMELDQDYHEARAELIGTLEARIQQIGDEQ